MERKSFTWSPLHYGSALVLIAADWLVYATNIATLGSEFLTVDVLGAAAALIGVAVVEGEVARVRPASAWLKALACSLLVAAPLPALGTVVGLIALTWSLAVRVRRSHAA